MKDILVMVFISIALAVGMVTFALQSSQWKGDYITVSRTLEEAHVESDSLSEQYRNEIAELNTEIGNLMKEMDKIASLQLVGFTSPIEMENIIKTLPLSSPFDSPFKVTARFGEGPGFGGAYRTSHQGTDLVPSGSWYVRSMWPGVVTDIGIDRYFGKYIVVQHTDTIRTRYHHLEKIYNTALPESVVDHDTKIGVMGATGYADGAHLHVELQVYNGEQWVSVDIYPFLDRS